jgi:hypothetical protein
MNRPLKSPIRDIINKYDICHNNYKICAAIHILYTVLVIILYILLFMLKLYIYVYIFLDYINLHHQY